MKLFSKILILSILLGSLKINAQIIRAEIIATGLTCSMCSNAINKQLKKLSDFDKVSIDLNTNTFIVTFKNGNQISPKDLKNSIQKAGFFVGSMIITFDPKAKLTANYIFLDEKITPQFKVLDKGYLVMKDFKKAQKNYASTPSFLKDNESDFHLIASK